MKEVVLVLFHNIPAKSGLICKPNEDKREMLKLDCLETYLVMLNIEIFKMEF